MFDYSGMAALAAVVREGSFERAARRLHITPSAVSQRVKQLEEATGQVLVQRGKPCVGTEAGRRLCLHLEQVALLENELRRSNPALMPDMEAPAPSLKLAVNADSLATWFMTAMESFSGAGNELLDISIDDENYTAQRLREGDVLAAVTASGTSIAGCNVLPLGEMRYVATASPAYMARYCADGVTQESMSRAPVLLFSRKDRLQENWLAHYGLNARRQPPRHFIPTVSGYERACEAGMGWGMHPTVLIERQLAEGSLVQLAPDMPLHVPLYWAYPRTAQASLERLTRCVMRAARQWLHGADPVIEAG